jgi:hypothetical protein
MPDMSKNIGIMILWDTGYNYLHVANFLIRFVDYIQIRGANNIFFICKAMGNQSASQRAIGKRIISEES